MENKFYFLLFSLLVSGMLSARAQDSSRCNAAFQASVDGNGYYFRAADSLAGITHTWNFGDTSVWFAGGVGVYHTYLNPGTYTVHQIVSASGGCTDSSSLTLTINPPPGPLCSLSFIVSGDSSHHLYSFVAMPVLAGGVIDTISWTINDTLVGMGDSLPNRYLPNGNFTVCAYMSTSLGCRVQSCQTIGVLDSVPSNPTPPIIPDSCTISFSAVPNPHRSNEYTFTVLDNTRYGSIIWYGVNNHDTLPSFGPFQGPAFTHVFGDTGFYLIHVSAQVVPNGCAVSNAQYIRVDSIPAAPGNSVVSYPNPATTQVNLTVNLEKPAAIDIRIYNSMGNQVQLTTVSGYPGTNQITLPLASLPIGVYYIQLQYGDTILRSKIQKL